MSGQEPEDVAPSFEDELRARVEDFCDEWNLANDVEPALERLLTRLVHAGQRREIEELLAQRRGVTWTYLSDRLAKLREE